MLWTKTKFGFKGFKSVRFSVLPALLSVLFSLFVCSPANAVQQVSFSSGVSYDGYFSGFSSGQTSRVLPAEYSRTNQQVIYLTPSTLSSDEFANNKDIYLSGNIIFNVDYITSATPRPVNMSCPIFNDWVLTSESNCDMQDIVYGNSHYLVYSFQLKGITRNASNIINSKTIVIKFDIKNMSEREANMWFTPVLVSAGGGDYNRLVGINTSIDNAIGTLGVINNNILSQTSAISQLQTSANNIFNRLGNIESKVSDIYDRIGNMENNSDSERQQDAEDRDNIDNQQTESADESSDSSDQVSGATESLFSVIGSVLSAFSTPATNCNIDVDTGNLDLGTLNLCNAPSGVRNLIATISVIIFAIVIIRVSYYLINLVINKMEGMT